MSRSDERAAVLALLRRTGLHAPGVAEQIERGSALAALAEHLGAGTTLLPEDPTPLVDAAARAIAEWERDGHRLVTVKADDDGYPPALRTVHDRPALLFLAGDGEIVRRADGIAIVGSREASEAGRARARQFAEAFVDAGHPVVSGLAAGIDAATHRAAIDAGGRTVAVIATGLAHAYPPQNAALQAELVREHAVVSLYEPATRPSAENFRRRNGVMSGLALGTVIVEASPRSGTRVQARLALAHGRPVFLHEALLRQTWAMELAERPGVRVVEQATDVLAILGRPAGRLTGPLE